MQELIAMLNPERWRYQIVGLIALDPVPVSLLNPLGQHRLTEDHGNPHSWAACEIGVVSGTIHPTPPANPSN